MPRKATVPMKRFKHSTTDGRIWRGQRTKNRIIAAAQDFAAAGVLEPTGVQLAERAGVPLRTIYQHFARMSLLRKEALRPKGAVRPEASPVSVKRSKHPNIDGRLLRSEKTRKRIIAAFQGFVAQGILEPKGGELAKRAKVSLRAIYQHFHTAAVLRQESLTEEQWRAEASRLRALSDRELVEATLAGPLSRKARR